MQFRVGMETANIGWFGWLSDPHHFPLRGGSHKSNQQNFPLFIQDTMIYSCFHCDRMETWPSISFNCGEKICCLKKTIQVVTTSHHRNTPNKPITYWRLSETALCYFAGWWNKIKSSQKHGPNSSHEKVLNFSTTVGIPRCILWLCFTYPPGNEADHSK